MSSFTCRPDRYMNKTELDDLFKEFNAATNAGQSTAAIFSSLVNSVRQVYISAVMETREEMLCQYKEHAQELAVPRQSIFANLVNDVRQLYVSQIQQDLVSHDTPDESESITAQQDHRLAIQRAQLSAQREQEVAELGERHNRQLCEMRRERELERSRWGRSIANQWIVGIDVVYGDQESEKPPNCIKELTRRGDSTNFGLPGKYVWLVPTYDSDPTNALTSVGLSIQSHDDDSKRCLARGSPGKYRYLIPRSIKGVNKIYSMNLLRLSEAMPGAPIGYDGSTSDINDGRKGGWLYLIWKSQSI